MTYTLKIWYAATPDDGEPQVQAGMTHDQVFEYVRPEVGFMHDMLALEGRGVRRLCLEVEDANVAGDQLEALGVMRESARRHGLDV